MTPERHLEILRTEGARVAALPADALDAPVPSLPDWTVERVVRHLGKIHQWVAATFARDPDGPPADTSTLAGIPKGPDCLPAYRDALAALLAEFDRVGPDQPAASFIGEAVDTAWWARRQAHEVAVHRIDTHDAVHAAGGTAPAPLAVDGAADGIDEWARLFLATRWQQRYGDLPADLAGRTIHVHGTDDPTPPDGAEWLFTFGGRADRRGFEPERPAAKPQERGESVVISEAPAEERSDLVHEAALSARPPCQVEVAVTHAKGDVALRGPAADLFLVLWRRRPLDLLDVIGDRSLAEHVLDLAQF